MVGLTISAAVAVVAFKAQAYPGGNRAEKAAILDEPEAGPAKIN